MPAVVVREQALRNWRLEIDVSCEDLIVL
jgi:hypothetical protein